MRRYCLIWNGDEAAVSVECLPWLSWRFKKQNRVRDDPMDVAVNLKVQIKRSQNSWKARAHPGKGKINRDDGEFTIGSHS